MKCIIKNTTPEKYANAPIFVIMCAETNNQFFLFALSSIYDHIRYNLHQMNITNRDQN